MFLCSIILLDSRIVDKQSTSNYIFKNQHTWKLKLYLERCFEKSEKSIFSNTLNSICRSILKQTLLENQTALFADFDKHFEEEKKGITIFIQVL